MAGGRLNLGYVGALLFSLVAMAVAYQLADSYIDRLPDHRGFHLVAVENEVTTPPLQKPRRTVVVVVDGLRQDSARTMQSTSRLAAMGQCRTTSTGPITISRPVYAVISTGLEQDRSGSRNNDDTSPIAAQSIWEVAQDAGLKVHAASNLGWWGELFPGAFTSYRFDLDEATNFLVEEDLAELSLLHPLRVDTAGHSYGAASTEYRNAVATVDTELSGLMDQLDFDRDLLILTADHGHSASGGHGGTTQEIAEVLTCFAGPTIARKEGNVRTDARVIAPTLSVLLGLPFPKHMRAGDDNLDQIWSLVRTDLLGAAYVQERKATIQRFRSENAAQVGALLGKTSGSWNELYDAGSRNHHIRWLVVALFILVLLLVTSRVRRQPLHSVLTSLLWMTAGLSVSFLLYTWVRGSFDFTSINKRQEFLNASLGVSLSVGVAFAAAHYAIWRDRKRLFLDHGTLLLGLLLVSLAHPLIYGITLGFPLPGRIALFLPFILGAQVIASGAISSVLAVLLLMGTRGRRSRKEQVPPE